MTAPQRDLDDPWALPDYRSRIALARSILGHANPTDPQTKTAIDRALQVLSGEPIEAS